MYDERVLKKDLLLEYFLHVKVREQVRVRLKSRKARLFKFVSSSLKNVMNEPEHSKTRLDSARSQPYK